MKKCIPGIAVAVLALTSMAYANQPDNNSANDGRLPQNYAEFWRQILPHGDGWASLNGGTTGGAAASYNTNVSTWEEFKAAVAGNETRLVVVTGPLKAFSVTGSEPGIPSCDTFAHSVIVQDGHPRAFSMAEYIQHFNPSTWGMIPPSGPLEEARVQAARAQTAVVRAIIGSNKTIVSSMGYKIQGGQLYINGANNVIVRNLEVSDAYDCFPQWDPTDGSQGNWNALYDNISVINNSSNVWIDRLTLNDGEHPPWSLPTVFGRKFEVHDGLLDITHGSDLVTVTNTIFTEHDKTNLVGSSDNRPADEGKLRVTWHGNLWKDTGQRSPRLRYGQNDIYNNFYQVTNVSLYQYSFGVGFQSSIYAEKNAFRLPAGVNTQRIINVFNGGTHIRTYDNRVNGLTVDIREVYNANTSGTQLADLTDWTPHLRPYVLPSANVEQSVLGNAGARRVELCDPVHNHPDCQPDSDGTQQ